jgi:hypothetical protein
MRMISPEAATPESARALYSAVSPFHPELDTDDEGKCVVSVSVGSQKETLEVLRHHSAASRRRSRFDHELGDDRSTDQSLAPSRGNGGSA